LELPFPKGSSSGSFSSVTPLETGRFGRFRTPISDRGKTVRIQTETPVRIETEISVRNAFRIHCPNNSEMPVRLPPKYAVAALQAVQGDLLKLIEELQLKTEKPAQQPSRD
jgi:hypothetical protein